MPWTRAEVTSLLRDQAENACTDYRPNADGDCVLCDEDFHAHLMQTAATLLETPDTSLTIGEAVAQLADRAAQKACLCGHVLHDHFRGSQLGNCQIWDCRCQYFTDAALVPADQTSGSPVVPPAS